MPSPFGYVVNVKPIEAESYAKWMENDRSMKYWADRGLKLFLPEVGLRRDQHNLFFGPAGVYTKIGGKAGFGPPPDTRLEDFLGVDVFGGLSEWVARYPQFDSMTFDPDKNSVPKWKAEIFGPDEMRMVRSNDHLTHMVGFRAAGRLPVTSLPEDFADRLNYRGRTTEAAADLIKLA